MTCQTELSVMKEIFKCPCEKLCEMLDDWKFHITEVIFRGNMEIF